MAPKNESTDSPAGGKSLVDGLVKTDKYTRGVCRSDLNPSPTFGVSSGRGHVTRFFSERVISEEVMSGGRVCPRQLKKIELHAVRIGDNLLKMSKQIGVLFDGRMTMEYVARDSGVQFCYCQPTEYNATIRRYATHRPTEQIVNAFVTS